MEQTLSIVKHNAVNKNVIGKVISKFEENELRVAGMKMVHLTREMASKFYEEHQGKPFFEGLISFMTEGPVVVMVLEGEKAIEKNRHLMGATNPEKAEPNTLRKLFGDDFTRNAVHGSDSVNSAEREIGFFFNESEVISRYSLPNTTH